MSCECEWVVNVYTWGEGAAASMPLWPTATVLDMLLCCGADKTDVQAGFEELPADSFALASLS